MVFSSAFTVFSIILFFINTSKIKASSATTTPKSNINNIGSTVLLNTNKDIPSDEIEQNIASHQEELTSSQKGCYFSGPCDDFHTHTKGYRISPTYVLPDFNSEFCKNDNALVHVTEEPLLTKEECQEIIDITETYFSDGVWSKLPSGRFTISGSWIKDIIPLRTLFNTLLQKKLFSIISKLYPDIVLDSSDLSIQSAYIFKYTPESGEKTDMHMDSSLLSFTILLNDPSDFEGGGTYFECLEDNIISLSRGQVIFRPAALRHRGQPITSGTRYVIGGFVVNNKKCEHVRQFMNRGSKSLVDGKIGQAKQLFEYARRINPSFSEIYMSIAHTKRKFNDLRGAMEDYKKSYELNPRNADAAYMIGVMYGELNKNEDDDALRWYQKAIELNEYDGDAYYRQGLIYGRFGNRNAEKEMYKKVIQVQPDHVDAHCNLGVCYGEEGSSEKEIECYERALQIEPHHEDAIQNLKSAYYHRGVSAYQSGNLEDAKIAFGRILNGIAPNEPVIKQLYDALVQRQQKEQQGAM